MVEVDGRKGKKKSGKCGKGGLWRNDECRNVRPFVTCSTLCDPIESFNISMFELRIIYAFVSNKILLKLILTKIHDMNTMLSVLFYRQPVQRDPMVN